MLREDIKIIPPGRHGAYTMVFDPVSEVYFKISAVAAQIMAKLDRGVTSLKGEGMFTGNDKKVLLCVCSSRELVAVQDIVKKHDPKAFFVVGDVAEVRGEGFIEEWA